ncbi:MAG: type II toxin-antitoxin system prevent-host-death family antitoxin [Clostridia bacterium]|nr:type II toxin-antitoxin system prevent-host-death family antitoxin [Clostridia bacterium]
MDRYISIRPSKDIRTNYAGISALTRENPVAITVNGKEDTVLLSHEDYRDQLAYISELEAKLAVYAHLAQATDDIKLGRVQDADAAIADILGELETLDI